METSPMHRRLIGEVPYVLLLSAPRLIAESLKARLEQLQIPVWLQTPFSLPEVYLGAYTGDVGLWVPEVLYKDADMVIQRDSGSQGEQV
jgi:hypothetical protein